MPELSDRVVDEVRKRLNLLGMSGRQLAELADVPQRTLADKLALRSPFTLDDLERVCGVFGVPPADVLLAVEGEGIELRKVDVIDGQLDLVDEVDEWTGPEPFPASWCVRDGELAELPPPE